MWNLMNDMLFFLFENMIKKLEVIIKFIKRVMISFVLKLFDFLGYVEFIIVKVKIMI